MCIQDNSQERTNSEIRRSYLESLAIPVPSIQFGHDQTGEPGGGDVFIQSQTPQGGSSTQASLSPPKDSSTPQSPSSSQSSSSLFLNLRNRRSKGKERSKSRASRGTTIKKNFSNVFLKYFFIISPTTTGLPAQAFDFYCSFIFQMKRVMVHQHESPKDDSQISGMASNLLLCANIGDITTGRWATCRKINRRNHTARSPSFHRLKKKKIPLCCFKSLWLSTVYRTPKKNFGKKFL